ncbi:hypothetical protein ACOXXX_16820 [Thalassococcus sp. BH17M4-6]|uniref:hypothetical protein n=1 Tax=Thalassococcus sp. BH17M4-6 TaxID=3413148 RepID=UPI003BD9CDFB
MTETPEALPGYTYGAPARTPRSVGLLLGLWALLAVGWIWLQVESWIVLGILLFTLPLLWEVATGKTARLTLDDTTLDWQSGRVQDHVALRDLDHVRLDRRFDGSMRATLVLQDGRKTRLPHDCVPPHRAFEATLKARGVKVDRHPFSIL